MGNLTGMRYGLTLCNGGIYRLTEQNKVSTLTNRVKASPTNMLEWHKIAGGIWFGDLYWQLGQRSSCGSLDQLFLNED